MKMINILIVFFVLTSCATLKDFSLEDCATCSELNEGLKTADSVRVETKLDSNRLKIYTWYSCGTETDTFSHHYQETIFEKRHYDGEIVVVAKSIAKMKNPDSDFFETYWIKDISPR